MNPGLLILFVLSGTDLADMIERDPRAALSVLADLAQNNPLARPWIYYGMLKAHLGAGEPGGAEALLDSLEAPQLPSGLRRIFDYYLKASKPGPVLALSGRYPKVVASHPDLLWRKARAEKLAGLRARAHGTLMLLVDSFPRSRYALRALSATKTTRGDSAWVLAKRGKHRRVLKLFRKAPPSTGKGYAGFLISTYKTKNYQRVISLYERNGLGGNQGLAARDILFYAGLAYWRTGDDDGALEVFARLVGLDPLRACREASFVMVASSKDTSWKIARYRSFLKILRENPSPRVHLRLGLLGVALEQYGDAEECLKRALALGPDLATQGRCYYWLWRVTGDPLWKARLLATDPVSYYAFKARPWIPLSEQDPLDWAGLSSSPQEAQKAAEIIARLGLLEDSPSDWFAGHPALCWAGGVLAARNGDFLTASRLFTILYRAAPRRDTLPRALVEAMYPFYYREEIQWASDTNGIDPLLLMAVAREESRFDPGAVSPAGAKGIVQLMGFTARRIRKKTGYKYDIFDVKDNLFLGAYHLRERLDKYGKVYAAVAAYNGGPRATDRWMRTMAGWPEDLFLEFITYNETRAYTRRVLKSYLIYRWLATPREPGGPE